MSEIRLYLGTMRKKIMANGSENHLLTVFEPLVMGLEKN
jgi:hypothetical protein